MNNIPEYPYRSISNLSSLSKALRLEEDRLKIIYENSDSYYFRGCPR